MEHNTPGALHFPSLLSPSLQENTPLVKPVSIAVYICKIVQLILCIDVHSFAIIRAEENYEHLAEGFGDVFSEINGLI